jgi:peptidoglycan/xylan/chitin deacetylase (PgdA/CDA1 family)
MFSVRPFALRHVAAAILALVATPLHAGTVALTFDDLPVFGRYDVAADGAADGAAITDRLLDGFVRHRWKVTGFVNEIQLDAPDRAARTALLAHWLAAGMDLGNHTYSHLSLNRTPVDAYIADTARNEAVTGALLAGRGRRERWFRYPYLETGLTPAVRRQFEGWLHDHGYRVAPVTMENSDWQFSAPYDDALQRGDTKRAHEIRAEYLTFTTRIVDWYRRAGTALFGREPAFVFLLHASRLNAASIDDLAAILARAHLRVVPLATAMRDPAYRTADTYVGPDGNEWLERWSETLRRPLQYDGVPVVPAGIVAEDSRLEGPADAPVPTPAPTTAPTTGTPPR